MRFNLKSLLGARGWYILCAAIIAVLTVVGFVFLLTRPAKAPEKPKSENPKAITFVHMIKANIITIGQPAREGIVFLLPNSKNFCGPSKGPRDVPIFVPDEKVDKNNFLVVKKTSPRIFVQGLEFQESYSYVEIHYNVDHIEPQSQPYPTINCNNQ